MPRRRHESSDEDEEGKDTICSMQCEKILRNSTIFLPNCDSVVARSNVSWLWHNKDSDTSV